MATLTAATVGKKTMQDVWNYYQSLIKTDNTVYCNGKWGQFNAGGRQQFDCVCTIKACGWGVPVNVDITANQYDYISKNKSTMPDVSIAYFYNNATRKSTDMAQIPADIITFVYQNTGHIGIYNPATGTVCETCAGNTMKTRELALSKYPSGYWNRWSNGYYFTDSVVSSSSASSTAASASKPTASTSSNIKVYNYQGYLDVASANTVGGWCWNGTDDSSCAVTIKIYCGTTLKKTVTVTADVYRADLKAAAKGNGYHGFSTNVDLCTLGSGTYTIKTYAPDGTQLINTKTVTVQAAQVSVLTAASYPDYTASADYYRVRKSFNDSLSSKGSFKVWKYAYSAWNTYKDAGYHVYDKNGKQLD